MTSWSWASPTIDSASASAAVVQPVSGRGDPPTLEELAAHARTELAGYKVPRALVVVDEVVRSPVGKPDYRWAQDTAVAGLDAGATATPASP